MKPKLLFLCTGNSCRSQMAEGFAKKFWSDDYDVYSAGTQKHSLNQRAVAVMREAGIDISNHYSKLVTEIGVERFDYIVTVCDSAKESCPYFPGGKTVHIGFADPPTVTKDLLDEEAVMKVYRRVRDEIEQAVRSLKSKL